MGGATSSCWGVPCQSDGDIRPCYWQNMTCLTGHRPDTFAVQKQQKVKKESFMKNPSFGKKVLAVTLGICIVVLIVINVMQDELLILGINK